MIRSAVLIQYTRVTDRQTDGIGVAYTRYSIYAVARKNRSIFGEDMDKIMLSLCFDSVHIVSDKTRNVHCNWSHSWSSTSMWNTERFVKIQV